MPCLGMYRPLIRSSMGNLQHRSFVRSARLRSLRLSSLEMSGSRNSDMSVQVVFDPETNAEGAVSALAARGITAEIITEEDLQRTGLAVCCRVYRWMPSTGLFRLQPASQQIADGFDDLPSWIDPQVSYEQLLDEKGWGFLGYDPEEEMSPFDVEVANRDTQYVPLWAESQRDAVHGLAPSGWNITAMSRIEVEERAAGLPSLSRRVLVEAATEPEGYKTTANGHKIRYCDGIEGIFCCAISGIPLFTTSDLKSETTSSGWLSFQSPVHDSHIIYREDLSIGGMPRTEVLSAHSQCHLGHYFEGEGYCINACALEFHIRDKLLPPISRPLGEVRGIDNLLLLETVSLTPTQEIILAAGCFWGIQHALSTFPGILNTQCGYIGGSLVHPSYEDVRKGTSGHAEAVKVLYDSDKTTLSQILAAFLSLHDPSMVRAVGPYEKGVGQYRSCIFLKHPNQAAEASLVVNDCAKQLKMNLATQIVDWTQTNGWWPAEQQHQLYLERQKGLDRISHSSLQGWFEAHATRAPPVLGSAQSQEHYT
mmetsp:Transcript_46388/g.72630  ORF Transcript_46388/g.72630 Transcript_46388/m.72630 type:complete len:537 (-) Transcript_46388:1199-2809(-)